MADDSTHAALNDRLALALSAPPSPPELRAQVLAAIAREPAIDWQSRRLELIRDHRLAIAKLNRLYVRRCRDALLIGSGVLVMIGLVVKPLTAGLTPLFAGAAPGVAGALALCTGLLSGVMLARDFFASRPAVSAQ